MSSLLDVLPESVAAPSSTEVAGLSERFRRRFARRTTSGRVITEIDGLRFPAIAIVVIGHLSSFFLVRGGYGPPNTFLDRLVAAPMRFAAEGVSLFFIISGFVLALPFARWHVSHGDRVSLKSYFLRRLTRLEPPYLVALTLLAAIEIAAARHHIVGRTGTTQEIASHYAASTVYLHNLLFAERSTINPPSWSLEIEVQFYLLVPLLTVLFRVQRAAWRRGLIVAAALAAIGLQQLFGATHPRIGLSILGHIQFFLLGFLLADLYLFAPSLRAPRRRRWDVVSLVGWPLLFMLWEQGPWAMALLPFVALGTFIAVFRGSITNRVFTNAWIATVGGMCYSIYLVHFGLLAALGYGIRYVVHPTGRMWLDFALQAPPLLATAMVICAVFFLLVEQPCMDRDWPRKLRAHVREMFRWMAPQRVA